VIKYTPREAYAASFLGEKQRGAIFTGPGSMKAANICGLISVGAVSSDPQKYTKVRHKKNQCCGSMTFWVWIRIRGAMPLTNGSGSCYFHH
jgi:hypothetical protein